MPFKFNPTTGQLDLVNGVPDLSGYVPYTGATTDVDLGDNNLIIGNADINVGTDGVDGGTITAYGPQLFALLNPSFTWDPVGNFGAGHNIDISGGTFGGNIALGVNVDATLSPNYTV